MPRASELTTEIRRHLAAASRGVEVDAARAGTVSPSANALEAVDAADLAEQFAHAVEDVNRRLQRCARLVRDGRSAEAVHQADLAPPVLDEAAELDMPERAAWVERCKAQGWPMPPEVDLNAAAELNEAYPRAQRLDRLLRTHRRLAIGRAPLVQRLKVLRLLHAAESDSPIWRDDVVVFERERHRQLAREVEQAWSARDPGLIRGLLHECVDEHWETPPPRMLCDQLKQMARTLKAEALREERVAIAASIVEAHKHEQAGELRSRLDRYAKLGKQLGDRDRQQEAPDQSTQVDAAAGWLASFDEDAREAAAFDRACGELETSLDLHKSADELERQYALVERFGRKIPGVLRNRYDARRAEQALEFSRRHRVRVMATVLVVLLLAVGVGVTIYLVNLRRQTDGYRVLVASLVADQNWDEAEATLGKLQVEHPGIYADPAIQEQRIALQTQRQLEADRLAAYETAMSRAEAAAIDQPDDEAIDEATSLAETGEERLRIERLRTAIADHQQAAQDDRDNAFRASLESWREQHAAVVDDATLSPAERVSKLESLRTTLRELQQAEQVAAALMQSAGSDMDRLVRLIDDERQAISEQAATDRDLAAIVSGFQSIEVHADRLNRFIEAHPRHPLAGPFREALRVEQGWRGIAAWLAADLPEALSVTTLDEVERLQAAVSSLMDSEPQLVVGRPMSQWASYLDQAEASLAPSAAPEFREGTVFKVLTHRLVQDLYMVEDKSGRRFYMPPNQAVEVDEHDIAIVRYIANDDQAFGRSPLSAKVLDRGDLTANIKPRLSPQSQFAREAWALLGDQAAWESRYVQLSGMLQRRDDLDPILKLDMMRALVELSLRYDWLPTPTSTQTSTSPPTLTPTLTTWLDQAKRFDPGRRWLGPYDEQAGALREQATVLLDDLPPLAPMAEAATMALRALEVQLKKRPAVALIMRNDAGQMTLHVPDAGTLQARLSVVAGTSQDGFAFRPVATMNAGRFAWLEGAVEPAAGTIMFAGPLVGAPVDANASADADANADAGSTTTSTATSSTSSESQVAESDSP